MNCGDGQLNLKCPNNAQSVQNCSGSGGGGGRRLVVKEHNGYPNYR